VFVHDRIPFYSNYFALRYTSLNVNNRELINFSLNFISRIHYLIYIRPNIQKLFVYAQNTSCTRICYIYCQVMCFSVSCEQHKGCNSKSWIGFLSSFFPFLSLFLQPSFPISTNHLCVDLNWSGKGGSKNCLLGKEWKILMYNQKVATRRMFQDISAGSKLPIFLIIP
jgi:hypothetical protein